MSISNSTSNGGAVIGEARVSVPMLENVNRDENVTVSASDIRFEDGCVEVSLDITVAQSSLEDESDRLSNVAPDTEQSRGSTVETADDPDYTDPEALKAVYDDCDTFPEMTRALDADVTSETVRRHMVEHGIHNPSGKTEQTESDAVESSDQAESGEEAAETAVNDDVESRSIVELLEQTDLNDDETLIADGSGIPQSLTVGELTDVIDRSRTVTEAKRELDISYERTRRILHDLDLIEFVTGRLASSYAEVPPELVVQRVTDSTDTME